MCAAKQRILAAAAGALCALLLTAGFAYADTITDTGVILNDQGVLVPSGYDPEQLAVERVAPDTVQGAPFRFVSPLIDIQFLNGGSQTALPASLTYVYFNMNHIERSAWNLGRAGIYYRAGNSGAWTACSGTFLVAGENPPSGRLACVVPQSAVYGLGIREVPADLVPGAQVGTGVETASLVMDNLAQTGNQGVYMPSGLDTERIAIRLVDPNLESIPDAPFDIRRPLLRIDWIGDELPVILTQTQEGEFEASTAAEPASLTNLAYVFYVLDNVSRTLWDAGELSIYYYDAAQGAWQVCPTILAENGAHGTISCIASQFTYYALGISESTQGGVGE
jgi:hypothetical protein